MLGAASWAWGFWHVDAKLAVASVTLLIVNPTGCGLAIHLPRIRCQRRFPRLLVLCRADGDLPLSKGHSDCPRPRQVVCGWSIRCDDDWSVLLRIGDK